MATPLYRSTLDSNERLTFGEALLKGQANRGGLFVPESYRPLDRDLVESMSGMGYADIGTSVMRPLIGDEISESCFREMCMDAYGFDVPIEPVRGKYGRHVMRLDRGPTASFKDFAAQMMGRLVSYYLEAEDKDLIVLTATSGDTGSAVASAFYNKPRIKLAILFPELEVTANQRRLMTTLGGNVYPIAVKGKFDDCQAMVTAAFIDDELAYLPLTSANSKNIGRLLPQMVYYFYAASRMSDYGEKPIFSVPSGNFGDLTAGLMAQRMGLPVEFFMAAVNGNDEFPNFLYSGRYQKVDPSRNCLSNAMNVGHPSNLPRIVDMFGGTMTPKGEMTRAPDMKGMRRTMVSMSVSDAETVEAMKKAWDKHNVLLEPHGAVGWAAMERLIHKGFDWHPSVLLETAHPAKFPEIIRSQLGIEPELPESMVGLDLKPENYETMPAEYQALKEFLKQQF